MIIEHALYASGSLRVVFSTYVHTRRPQPIAENLKLLVFILIVPTSTQGSASKVEERWLLDHADGCLHLAPMPWHDNPQPETGKPQVKLQ